MSVTAVTASCDPPSMHGRGTRHTGREPDTCGGSSETDTKHSKVAEQGMEAGNTGQSTTEAARTTRRSALTIAQLRVGGAWMDHTSQWRECLQVSSRSNEERGIGGMWSESTWRSEGRSRDLPFASATSGRRADDLIRSGFDPKSE
eukprot:2165410-Prymnesium_polylepis.1